MKKVVELILAFFIAFVLIIGIATFYIGLSSVLLWLPIRYLIVPIFNLNPIPFKAVVGIVAVLYALKSIFSNNDNKK